MVRALIYSQEAGVQKLDENELRVPAKNEVLWVDMEEPSDEEAMILTRVFGFHDLAVEDCLTLNHQPKIDRYDKYLFIVVRAIAKSSKGLAPGTIGLNAFLGRRYLVTFHRSELPNIEQTFEKCRINGDILAKGADFLYHQLLDTQVDRYFPILSAVEDEVERVEALVLEQKATEDTYKRIFHLKSDITRLERIISEQMRVVNDLRKEMSELVSRKSAAYYSDIYDNLRRIRNILYLYRDNLVATFDVSVNLSSQKTSEIMRVLTIIATIMMPLTVITGVYGMNFRSMPELDWKYGYLFAIGIMVLITAGMLIFFKKKKWI